MIFFQKNLSLLRSEKSMTLSQIAQELGFSASQWSNYEQGISFPKFLDLIKIANYFKISETDLIHVNLEHKHLIKIERDLIQNETDKSNIELIATQKKLISALEEKINELQNKLKL